MKETMKDNATDVNLAYPDAHVMGMKSHMDPYLFGVKVSEGLVIDLLSACTHVEICHKDG